MVQKVQTSTPVNNPLEGWDPDPFTWLIVHYIDYISWTDWDDFLKEHFELRN
jgi:hypothetical protein